MQNYLYISHILLRTHARMHFKMTIKAFIRFLSVSLFKKEITWMILNVFFAQFYDTLMAFQV